MGSLVNMMVRLYVVCKKCNNKISIPVEIMKWSDWIAFPVRVRCPYCNHEDVYMIFYYDLA